MCLLSDYGCIAECEIGIAITHTCIFLTGNREHQNGFIAIFFSFKELLAIKFADDTCGVSKRRFFCSSQAINESDTIRIKIALISASK